MPGDTEVLVPVKAFHQAKQRLAPVLGPADRAALARQLATGVVQAAAPLPVRVVCDDPEVADWARGLGALVAWTPDLGLNGAVEAAMAESAAAGFTTVVVAHADLARPERLVELPGAPALVPDHRRDGTNVLVVACSIGFGFGYGPGSFDRHVAEFHRHGLVPRVVDHTDLAFDVDTPDDWRRFVGLTRA